MLLSILIPSMYKRAGMLASMMRSLYEQVLENDASEYVEILVNVDEGADVSGKTTGRKRNELINAAKGEYVIFVDDDDQIPSYYVGEFIKACRSRADCFAISGLISTNGVDEKRWYISKDLNYCALIDEFGREVYHRYTNHLTGLKKSIAIQIKFPDITVGEDYKWATDLKNSGLLKTEYKIERFPMYYYKFINNK